VDSGRPIPALELQLAANRESHLGPCWRAAASAIYCSGVSGSGLGRCQALWSVV